MSTRPESLPGRRLSGRPPLGGLALRAFAIAIAVMGGLKAGEVLNGYRGYGERGFARAYTAAWIVRSANSKTAVYDPARFTVAAEEIAPTGSWKPFGHAPPASLVLALPFTVWQPASAAWSFAISSLCALLLLLWRLGGLAGPLFWNRSEWLVLAGFALGSPLFVDALMQGSNVPWAVCLLAIAFSFWERGRRTAASICLGGLLALSGFGLVLLGFLFRRGFRREAGLALGAGILITLGGIAAFGPEIHGAWISSLVHAVSAPASLETASLPALLSRLFSPDPTRNPGAIARWPLLPAVATVCACFWFWRRTDPKSVGGEVALDALGGRSAWASDLASAIAMSCLLDPMAAGVAGLFALVPFWSGLRIAVQEEVGAYRLWLLMGLAWLALGPLDVALETWFRAAGLLGLSLWLARVPRHDSTAQKVRDSASRLRLVPAA